ncbi:MAG: MATE family efflux transporter [Clostridia bacterium]|nr:MATE family efflux transporter [Clostridia bacterium]
MKDLIVKDRGFYKSVLVMALPIVLQSMITIGVNIMDTVMLGSFGETQISASSLANSYIDIFHILHMGIGGGAGVLIGQYWGMRDKARIKRVVSIMFRICLAAVVLFTVLAAMAPAGIMRFYTKDPEVIAKGRTYLLWSLSGFFLHGVTLVMTLSLRSMKDVRVPFIASCVSFFVNIFFNWVFIFGKLGAPRMEIAGAALGTVLARVTEAAIIGFYYFRREQRIAIRLRDLLEPPGEEWGRFMRFGTAVVFSDLALVVGQNVLAMIMGHIGTPFVAANSIVSPVMRLCNVFAMGLTNASAAFTGNTIGEKGIEEGKKVGTTFAFLSVGAGVLAGVLLLLICPAVTGLYNVTEETQGIARQLMYGVALTMPLFTLQGSLTKGVLRAGGDTKFVLVVEIVTLWCCALPLGALCGLYWGLSPFLIYLALRSDYLLKALSCVFRLRSGKWIQRIG